MFRIVLIAVFVLNIFVGLSANAFETGVNGVGVPVFSGENAHPDSCDIQSRIADSYQNFACAIASSTRTNSHRCQVDIAPTIENFAGFVQLPGRATREQRQARFDACGQSPALQPPRRFDA